VHSQYTTKYLGRRIVSIVWADSDITVAALIEVIHDLIMYRVHEGKGAHIGTFVGRLERSLYKSAEIVTWHSTLQPRHQMRHRFLWSVAAQ
jgi:hypothetical protein